MAPVRALSSGASLAERVGRRIRELRRSRGLTLTDVQNKTGIDPSNQSKIERGAYLTTVERYASIATALGVDLADLFRVPRPPNRRCA